MLAVLWQDNLMATLDTYVEDVDLRSPVTRAKSAGISSLKPRHGREIAAAFFKELLEKVWLG